MILKQIAIEEEEEQKAQQQRSRNAGGELTKTKTSVDKPDAKASLLHVMQLSASTANTASGTVKTNAGMLSAS